jgi:aspartyl protease family protein
MKIFKAKDKTYILTKMVKWKLPIILVFAILLVSYCYMSHKNSQEADFLFAIASDSYREGDLQKTEKYLGMALKKKRDHRFYYAAFKLLINEGRNSEANYYIDEAIKRSPNDLNYLYLGAQSSVAANRIDNAIKYMEKVTQIVPQNYDHKLYLAEILYVYKKDKLKEAINLLEEVISKDPHNYYGWEYLSNLYLNEDMIEESYGVRKKANKYFSVDSRQMLGLAKVSLKLHKNNETINILKKLISKDSEYTLTAAKLLSSLTGEDIDKILGKKILKRIYKFNFILDSGTMLVDGSFEGHPIRFLIDTGASHSVISKDFIEKTSLSISRSSPVAQYETANGVIQVPVVYGNYSIGDFVVTNVRTAILDSSTSRHEGIIGQNILSKYKVSIDNRNQVLTLEMPYYD